MGYYTTLSGEMRIEPPAKWSEIKDSPCIDSEDRLVWIEVEETREETDEGTLLTKKGVRVITYDDSVKAYDIESEFREIAALLPGHKFVGCIEGDGEESGDMWRCYIRKGKVIEHKVKSMWPDPPEDD